MTEVFVEQPLALPGSAKKGSPMVSDAPSVNSARLHKKKHFANPIFKESALRPILS